MWRPTWNTVKYCLNPLDGLENGHIMLHSTVEIEHYTKMRGAMTMADIEDSLSMGAVHYI